MSVGLVRIQSQPIDIFTPQKNRDPQVPVLSWLVARIKIEALTRPEPSGAASRNLEPLRGLRGSPWSHRQVPQLGQNAGHLHSVELRNKWQNLGYKLVFHQFADFILTALFTASE
jgi:hypothetical protein